MKKKFIDPYIEKKSKKSNELFQFFPETSIPLPSEVEISESGTCNRKCSFCPRSAQDFKDVKEFINDQLILKLVNELKNYYFRGTIRFSGFVEPLLDKNIFKLIKICRINFFNAFGICRCSPVCLAIPSKKRYIALYELSSGISLKGRFCRMRMGEGVSVACCKGIKSSRLEAEIGLKKERIEVIRT